MGINSFTIADVEVLEKNVGSVVVGRIDEIMPKVTAVARPHVSDRHMSALLPLVRWIFMVGKTALRDMPRYLMEQLGFGESAAFTISYEIVTKLQDDIHAIIPDVHLEALYSPWKAKVEKPDGIASSPRGETPRNDKIISVSAVSEPEVVAFEQKGLRHQDAEERLAIRVRMIEQLAGIKFNNQNLEERFRHAIRPALKGVKELDEVRRDLALTEDKGGVGMGQNQVDEVIGLIERLEAKDRELAARATVAKPEPPKSILPMVEEASDLIPIGLDSSAASQPQNDKKVAQNDSSKKLDQHIRQSAADQPMDLQRKMHDVIARPIAMGPVEELRATDLTDFRRLAAKAGAAADKIRQKLAVLREDGIDRYSAGIKAWRESPVYGVYTKMIRDGLVEGRSVEDLAASDTSDPERLSSEELQAVIELNKSLRF